MDEKDTRENCTFTTSFNKQCLFTVTSLKSFTYKVSLHSLIGSYSRYALDSSLTPKRIQGRLLSVNLVLLASGIWAYDRHPNTLKCSTTGFTPHHASCRVMSFTAKVGLLLNTYIAQVTASGQKFFGIFFSDSMLLTKFITVLFFRSATPFCCGVYAAVNCLLIPCCLQKSSNSCPLNSPLYQYANI